MKKVVLISIAGLSALSLFSCGDNGNSSTPSNSVTSDSVTSDSDSHNLIQSNYVDSAYGTIYSLNARNDEEGIEYYYSVSTFRDSDGLSVVARSDVEILSEISGIPVTTISSNAFWGSSLITEVALPSTITTIFSGAFNGCYNLESLNIPTNLSFLGADAFNGCSKLNDIELPDSLVYIANHAFKDCASLTSISIPEDVSYLGEGVFEGCVSLTAATLPSSITYLPKDTFKDCASLGEIQLPDSLLSIGESAFMGCTSLSNLYISYNVNSIGSNAFVNTGIETLQVHARNEIYQVYSGCLVDIPNKNIIAGFGDFSIPQNSYIRSIGESAFSFNQNVTSLYVPSNITSIGSFAFYGCCNLKSVNLDCPNLSTIGEGVFAYCPNLESYKVNESQELLSVSVNCLVYDGDYIINDSTYNLGKVIIAGNKYGNIPDGEEYKTIGIGAYAFAGFTELSVSSLTIPANTDFIDHHAFYGCTSIESLRFSDITILEYGFAYCSNLKEITFSAHSANIGDYAFYECGSLERVYSTSGGVVSFTVSSVGNDDLTRIPWDFSE